MSSIRSFPFLLGIFLSFFLTSCIPDPGWEEKDDFTFSWNISSSEIFPWTQNSPEETWDSFVPLSDWDFLTPEEVAEIRAKYTSGTSRDFIPYMIFGSGGFQIPDIQIRFHNFPYIPYQEEHYERIGEDHVIYLKAQREKQIIYYNNVFWKTINSENILSASGKYFCLRMQGSITKTDGILWLHTEISAIWGIPIDSTPLSEQFPLENGAYVYWVIIAGTWHAFSQTWKLITDIENIFSGSYQSMLPTIYENISWENYFVFRETRDNKNTPYTVSVHGEAISEVEWIHHVNMRDCTILTDNSPNHLTIHFIPPAEYTWGGQTQIDYRLFVKNGYFLQLPSWMGTLSDMLMTTNSWDILHPPITHTKPEKRMVRGEMEYRYAAPQNQPYCLDEWVCSLAIDAEALRDIASVEFFYDSER